jgi:Protein of unknown function (DUF2752)
LNKTKLYGFLLISCLLGYGWLYLNTQHKPNHGDELVVCPIKNSFHIPCPSCGSTRSVISLLNGDIGNAIYINPLGILLALMLFLLPIWIVMDILTKSKTLFIFFLKMEYYIKKPQFAVPLAILVLVNWVWNIRKNL